MNDHILKTVTFTNCWGNCSYIIKAIADKLAECDNMTISTPYGEPDYFSVKFNSDTLKLNYENIVNGYIGFGQTSGTGYVQLFDLPGSSGYGNPNGRVPFMTLKLAIELRNGEENLIAVLSDDKRQNFTSGVLFTNGGIKNLNDNNIYPIGSSTASKTYVTSALSAGCSTVTVKNDLEIYVSDCFVDAGAELELCDHLRYVYSNVKTMPSINVSANAFERISIDGQEYMRVEGNLWLPITSEVEETVEVVYS